MAQTTHATESSAPQITINRDVVEDDNSTAFEGPEKLLEVWFAPAADQLPEGTQPNGLLAVAAATWKTMLDLVNCKVLSTLNSDDVHSYLLSESSMFVWQHKLILKTCGTTTLLLGLRAMLEIAAEMARFPSAKSHSGKDTAVPYRVFYSRKNFLFPSKQLGPHKSWRDEVKYLDDMFSGGSAYMVGKMNSDHWYLYITAPNLSLLTPAASPSETMTKRLEAAAEGRVEDGAGSDETLEILMTDLDPETAKQFHRDHALRQADERFPHFAKLARREAVSNVGALGRNESAAAGPESSTSVESVFSRKLSLSGIDHASEAVHEMSREEVAEGHALGTVVAETSGLTAVYPTSRYPDATVAAFMFDPCGFSANGVVPAARAGQQADEGHYFTVHVTPEPHCSYASFETNVPGGSSGQGSIGVIRDVVSIFKPGRFSVTLFEATSEGASSRADAGQLGDVSASAGSGNGNGLQRSQTMEQIPGYRRTDRIVHDFDGYELVFRCYEREDWQGGAPRVGETDI